MKSVNVFCVNDNRLTVYNCRLSEIKIIDSFDFADTSVKLRFEEYADFYKKTKNYLLLDVSVEDYHQEKLPHVHGSDRKLLIRRKLEKYFPDGEYCYSTLVKRLKVGRRDDIYAISGITDSSVISQVVSGIESSCIDIAGVFSLPLLTENLISPVVHKDQILVVSCEEERGGRYSFRQTFIDNGHLYFSRQTSILSSPDQSADQFRKEIDRTWQYLNNKHVLTAGDRMQVILLTPPEFGRLLRNEAVASHSEYLFVDPVELASAHGLRADNCAVSLPVIASFFLSKKTPKKSHYQPKKLTAFHNHQKINKFLANASIFVVIAAVVVSVMNFIAYDNEVLKGEVLSYNEKEAVAELHSKSLGFRGIDPSPQELQAMVDVYRTIASVNSYPDFIFAFLSTSFANFQDLAISGIEWYVKPEGEGAWSEQDDSMDEYSSHDDSRAVAAGGMKVQPSSDQSLSNTQPIVIDIQGSVKGFKGNYRRAIERVEFLSSHISALNNVDNVIVTKLPLNVDPSIKTSRALSTAVIPHFGIRIFLNRRVLDNEH